MQDTKCPVERAKVSHGSHADCDYISILVKQPDSWLRKGKQQGSQHQCINDSHHHGHNHALFYPVKFPGTIVLSRKGSDCHAEAGNGQDIEAVDFHVSTKPRHSRRTECIHAGLNQHIGKGDDHVLKSGGQTNLNNPEGNPLLNFDFFPIHPILFGNAH